MHDAGTSEQYPGESKPKKLKKDDDLLFETQNYELHDLKNEIEQKVPPLQREEILKLNDQYIPGNQTDVIYFQFYFYFYLKISTINSLVTGQLLNLD